MVSLIKQKSAELINLLENVKNDEVYKTYEKSPEALKTVSGEKLRLIALAQTSYEEAAMWAVKAVTA
ncbi:Acb2/Tad1 domain-containing protein [Elizabethkingia anophelis]|uniref:Acb2/Tad1 domain-containing protein n=1 Tax=Elizabethkingia anophelis TaxID=1117645 RepID=UPI003F1C04A7